MAEPKITECGKLLAEKGLTIAFAESATAGWLCSEFALSPDSGKILKGGIVCYDAAIKEYLLKVPKDIIEKYTPESAEVTKEIAEKLKNLIKADIHVGVTGLTTAGGSETDDKPVGTIFVHIILKDKHIPHRREFDGDPENIIHQTVNCVAELLMDEVSRTD
ncbi:CinA family protein [Mucilaginibacter roseus]|uniref:CinA family protein n=1 Tax=Mucilaginibacter roseus TaxID=1528868 RepID=A0ABS8U8N3_9SPHI|nr:CinA family protein [Mucilaginibacter roseus]MCD8742575.1 CinA family protein [Mucilaginibacter roseus]